MKNKAGWFWRMVATGFGCGYSPIAPGTTGSIGALIPAIILLYTSSNAYLWLGLMIVVLGILGAVAANMLEIEWGHDASRIVIDEVVGMWISLMWIGKGWIAIVTAFILFRFFDAVKPAGIARFESLPGGIGVMADDVVAGIATNLLIQVGLFLLTMFGE